MKLFKSLVAVAAAFGAGYLTHQILAEEKKEREEADEVSLLELIEEELANGFDPEEELTEDDLRDGLTVRFALNPDYEQSQLEESEFDDDTDDGKRNDTKE